MHSRGDGPGDPADTTGAGLGIRFRDDQATNIVRDSAAKAATANGSLPAAMTMAPNTKRSSASVRLVTKPA